jgi:hypothetical protein
VVIVEDEVNRPNEIEGDDEKPEERSHPYQQVGQLTTRQPVDNSLMADENLAAGEQKANNSVLDSN